MLKCRQNAASRSHKRAEKSVSETGVKNDHAFCLGPFSEKENNDAGFVKLQPSYLKVNILSNHFFPL